MSESKVLTAALLAKLQDGVLTDRGYIGDIEAISKTGMYRVDTQTKGIPINIYGILLHLQVDASIAILQMYIDMQTQRIFIRSKWVNYSWLNWKEL